MTDAEDVTGQSCEEALRLESDVNKGEATRKRPQRQRKKKTFPDEADRVTPTYKYKQKYVQKWEKMPEYRAWLTRNPKTGRAHCLYCNTDINIERGKTQLSRHCERIKHKRNERLWHRKPLKSSRTVAASKSSGKLLEQQVQHAESQMILFLVENNLSLSLTEPLVSMVQMLPFIGEPVQRVQLSQSKAGNVVRQGFDTYFKQNVFKKLKKVLFSIVVDVCHDKQDSKHLVICVTYCDKKLQVQVDILDTFEIGADTVEGLFNKLRETLTELEESGVALKNWVGFLIDTTKDLFETTHQLAVFINECYPWVIPIRSPCHMTHLAASAACGTLPQNLEDFCKHLRSYFKENEIQSRALLDFQETCQLKDDKLFVPGQLQLLSVHTFIKQMVDLWDTLESYFSKSISNDENADSDWSSVCKVFQDPMTKVIFQFLEHVLSTISTYNKMFQMEEPFFFQLKRETQELICKLSLSFMRRDVVQSVSDMMDLQLVAADFLPLSEVYIGLEASSTLTAVIAKSQLSYQSPEILGVLEVCQDFYKDLVGEIQSKFDFSHPVFHLASIIDPQNAMNLQPPSLSEFFANYDHPEWNKNKIEAEWRVVCDLEFPLEEETIHSPLLFWRYVLSQRCPNGTFKFSNLQLVIQFFLSLPFSSVIEAKVSRFLKQVGISGRLNLLHASMEEYISLLNGVDIESLSYQQRRRRKHVKRDTAQI